MCECVVNFHFFFVVSLPFFVVDFTMDAIVDPNSGLASEAALRDTYLGQLEAFMAETRVLTAERVSLGDTKPDRQRKAAITERLADLKGNTDRRNPTMHRWLGLHSR